MKPKRTVLVVSHEASRTGAPIVLLRFLTWLKKHTEYEFRVLLAMDGELRSEFERIGETLVFDEVHLGVDRPLPLRALRKMGIAFQRDYHANRFESTYQRGAIDLVYANTIVTGRILGNLRYLGCPVIVHVHELNSVMQSYGVERSDPALALASAFISVSGAVTQTLVNRYAVQPAQITAIPECIDVAAFSDTARDSLLIRRRLGIESGSHIVGGSGLRNWRKGKDLFVQVAQSVRRQMRKELVRFLWVGGGGRGHERDELLHDVDRCGLSDCFHYVSQIDAPLPYYQAMDVFCMTSREDPYPLVNIEVGMCGVPIVCFSGSGGSPEFVGRDAGFCVPYLDTCAMADRVTQLVCDPALRERMGHCAAEKAAGHDVSQLGPRLAHVIERSMAQHKAPVDRGG